MTARTNGKRASSTAKKRSGRGGTSQGGWGRRLLKWGGISTLVLALVLAGGGFWFYNTMDIPDPNEDFLTETTKVLYSGGKKELGSFAVQERESIPLSEMPDNVKDAVIAAENQTFWTDEGIDPRGILRAAFSNAQGNATQGASTITQQYVKILYLTQDRTYTRKAKEAVLSLKVQNRLSKEEVLKGYLNTIYFGRGAYGIQAAAQSYFGKPAKKLNLRQAAVLASILNNPSRFDPANGDTARANLEVRYAYVLDSMAEMGTVSAQQAEQAKKRLPKFPTISSADRYGGQTGHALRLVREELQRLGFSDEEIDGGGLKVTTTFTPQDMNAAEKGVKEARPEGFSDEKLHVGVAVTEPRTGALRGMYGGQDYLDSQLNWAVKGGQAGSIFKPVALAAGITQGFALKDRFEGNSPIDVPGGEVENQGDRDYGSVDLVEATENSINTAFVDLTMGMDEGPEAIVEMAEKMGIPDNESDEKEPFGLPTTSPGLKPFLSVALGPQTVSPINMANGYGTIANRGERNDVFVVEKVVDDEGRTRYQHKVTGGRAMSKDIADDVSYALQRNAQVGTGSKSSAIGRPSAGKTGTATNDKGWVTSAWYTGYTPQRSVSVSYTRGDGVGRLDGWLPSFFGSDFPLDTWNAVMRRAMEGMEVQDFPPPANVDGEAPSEGYEPPPPPPTTTQQEEETQQPSSSSPTTEETTEQTEETSEPTPEPSPTKSSSSSTPSLPIGDGEESSEPADDSSSPSPSGSAGAQGRTTRGAGRRRRTADE